MAAFTELAATVEPIEQVHLLWLGRRKHTGRGEGSSGLRFDSLARPGD